MESWKRCIDEDDFSRPGIVRSHINDLYLILLEFAAALDSPNIRRSDMPDGIEARDGEGGRQVPQVR